MAQLINRRNWIRTTALFTGSAALFKGSDVLASAPAAPHFPAFVSDRQFAAALPPVPLKARLFANENPFGPSDKAKKAIQDAVTNSYQYPFLFTRELSEKIAAFEGLKTENILMGAGSSPLLRAAALLYSKNGGSIVTADPSYDDLPSSAAELGAKIIRVPLDAAGKIDLPAMEKAVAADTRLVYICNPNNPTATVLDTQELKAFCKRVSAKVPVFIDEAYIDYLPDPKAASVIDGVKEGQNIIVARTFSKLYGFAGLRVGYIAAAAPLIETLDKYTSGPNCISAPAVQAALAAYQDREFLASALEKTLASKKYLYDTLGKESYTYIPSSTNFVMFPLKMEGKRFTEEMMKRGVGVRNWKFAGKDWCRVSIGRMDEMQAFAEAFKQLS